MITYFIPPSSHYRLTPTRLFVILIRPGVGARRISPPGGRVGQTPHTSRVTVLISDFLFHFGVGESLEEGRPLLRVPGRAVGSFHQRQRCLAEGIRPRVPCDLPADAVRDGRHELSSKPQLSTQFLRMENLVR